MRTFFIILQKEVRELLSLKTLLPFLMVIVIFYFVGNVITKESQKNESARPIAVIDEDNSILTQNLIKSLPKINFKPQPFTGKASDMPKIFKDNSITFGLIIPSGFETSVTNFTPKKIETYTDLSHLSLAGIGKYAEIDKLAATFNEVISNQYINQKVPSVKISLIKNPIQSNSYTIIDNKTSKVNATVVLGYLAKQIYAVPLVLFMVIILASQMIATSVASEKENKTLETLLTAPINRKILVIAKMVAAGVVSLFLAGIYILGFRSYMNGLTNMNQGASVTVSNETLHQLGLVLTPQNYFLLGLVVFLGILVALAIAMILGAFAEDIKSVQSTIAPLMGLMMIPYFATTFLDVNTLPIVARLIVYAIPFTHVFLAMQNLYTHNYSFVAYGVLYEFIVFIVFVWIAAWIFSSDKIMTMKFNLKKKK